MKKNFLFKCAVIGAALSLAACVGGPSASNGIMQGQTQKGGFMGLSTKGDVEVTGDAAFKETKKVVIGSFLVGFATYKTDSAKAGGGLMGNGFGGKSTAKSTLTGVSPAAMQSIADKAYAQFVADLKKDGFEVVDRKTLLDYKGFASIKTSANPYEDSSGGLFGAKSKTVYYAPSSFDGIRMFMNEIPGQMGGFGFGNASVAAMEFAEKSEGVRVLNAVYVLDFANADSYGGSWRSTSSVSVGQGLTVVPGYSKLSLIGGYGGTFSTKQGTIALGQPVTSSHEFATVDDSTSGADLASQTAANVIGFLGGVGTNASRNYTFAAREGDYVKASQDALGQASGKLSAKLKALQ